MAKAKKKKKTAKKRAAKKKAPKIETYLVGSKVKAAVKKLGE